ncbi:ATP-grasp domain-containing protein [Flavobacterium salilacus subsp. salilacus]|uniref:ATP-grasp domain-containing protein n=1 Tax=Flavobacterium TaxID=237 RepID=UPI00107588D4|nr:MULTISPECIES: ATP-grasp domain-containing protein [Flavobacterium]KAF2519777.1 ATP-grasp domain-containing protein [Flavobacterium salilacus subsp. salilacus]MBE1614325.1 ATP-grasp domain-containing protein [Flavobacterium sp. SaA2.13]
MEKDKKAILIVGAGLGQVPAIKYANDNNIETFVVDKNPNAMGAKMANHFYEIDIIDKNAVLEIAKKHAVNGIMTMQSDIAVPTVGYVNDVLGLNGISLEVANFCSNKTETRKRLAVKNCAQPNFRIVTTLEEAKKAVAEIGLPCVVKSPDSSGSRGVTKISSESETEAAYNEALKYTRLSEILVEEYIEGLEFGAQTFSVKGVCTTVLLHNDTMSQPPYMIPVGHSFPFMHLSDDEKKQAVKDIKEAVEALGINEGPANVDLILDKKSNSVKVIEIGARIGATCLPELVEYHTGINWVGAAVHNCMGEDYSLTPVKNQAVAALILESPADGLFKKCDNQPEENPNLVEFELTVMEGEAVNKLRKGTDRIGKIVTLGKTVEEAEAYAQQLKDNLKFIIDEQ